jgi:CheY-like chemotaxis protein
MVIRLDIRQARMDGLEMLRCLRAGVGTPLLPVMALTSSNAEQDLIEGYASRGTSLRNLKLDLKKDLFDHSEK